MDVISHALVGALVGQALSPAGEDARLAGSVLGVVAAIAPDLDFLAELAGKRAAWRYHRAALHGLPSLLPLAALVTLGALASGAPLPAWRALGIATVAVFSHLVLDVLTSFGTVLLYPFSRRRFSTRSHFIVDPVVLVLSVAGVVSASPRYTLLTLSGYVMVSLLVRARVGARAHVELAALGHPGAVPFVEPRILAPLRWLVVAKVGERYAFCHATPWGLGPWSSTASGCDEHVLATARRDPVLAAFLDTCDFPRFEWSLRGTERWLLVEDVKWWLERPYRPLTFRARIDASGTPRDAVQSRITERSSVAHTIERFSPRGAHEQAAVEAP